jgi:hypothetical protein
MDVQVHHGLTGRLTAVEANVESVWLDRGQQVLANPIDRVPQLALLVGCAVEVRLDMAACDYQRVTWRNRKRIREREAQWRLRHEDPIDRTERARPHEALNIAQLGEAIKS